MPLDGEPEMIEIPLTQGQVALIDDEDFELVSQYKWCARWSPGMRSYYAVTTIRKPDGKRIHLQMHRLIMNAQKGEQVDHINHNTLDNRKSELRICNASENQHNRGKNLNNSSGNKGVYAHKASGKWQAQIALNGKTIHLGLFATKEEAYTAYCNAALELHGEFSKVA
jgi:hypothetical protein